MITHADEIIENDSNSIRLRRQLATSGTLGCCLAVAADDQHPTVLPRIEDQPALHVE